jgi:hypothetical protein
MIWKGFLNAEATARRSRNQSADRRKPQRRDTRRTLPKRSFLCFHRVSAVGLLPQKSSQAATKLGDSTTEDNAEVAEKRGGP